MNHSDARPDSAQNSSAPSRWLLPVVLVGAFMTILDFFIVNVALPSMQTGLSASPAQLQLVVAGYGLAYAVGLITGGRLGDIVGRRRMLLAGLVAFTTASVLCGAAPDAVLLVAARVVQGLSAAVLFPQVLSILNVAYEGSARARAFTAFGLTLGLASVAGQVLGGVLISAGIAGLTWRTCFLINAPIGIAAVLAAWRVVPESKSPTAHRLDLRGVALVTPGLALLVFPLVEGRQQGWPLWTWICLAAAPVVLCAFVVTQLRLAGGGGSPLVEPRLFRQRSFVAGIAVVLTFYAGLASLFLILSVYLQQGQGFDALGAGVTFLPLGLGFFATSANATRLAGWLGTQVLAVGAALMALSYVVLLLVVASAGSGVSTWMLAPGLLLNGLGQGAVMGPLISLVLAGVDPADAGSASGVLTTVQQIAGALGVAVIGIIFYGSLGAHPHPGLPYANAFRHGLIYTLVLVVMVAGLVQLLPHRDRRPS